MARQAETPTTSDYLTVPGAKLYYEVSGSGPVLLLIHGAPADASAFDPIVPILAEEYTVVRYDTRGISRSTLDEPAGEIPVATHADDAHRILEHVGAESASVLGSSGGAVISLALAEGYPEQVQTVVAHEPPLLKLLPVGDPRRNGAQDVAETFNTAGLGPAIGAFVALATGGGEATPPSAPPQGTPTPEQQAVQERIGMNFPTLFTSYLLPITDFQPDIAALQAGPTRVVVGIGETSAGTVPHDTALALAAELGSEPVIFPGGHGGYTEYPDTFVAKLQDVLQEG